MNGNQFSKKWSLSVMLRPENMTDPREIPDESQ